MRGRRHELAFVLYCFAYSILRLTGQITISRVHRMMQREYVNLARELDLPLSQCISDSQLRRVLSSLDYQGYNSLNEQYFGITLEEQSGVWQAIDGKELRGSIDGLSGQKRGENLVRIVDQESKTSQIIAYYQGGKESEKTVVKQYFATRQHLQACYSLDALHTSVGLLTTIAGKSGVYLAQVKNNQKYLLQDCKQIHAKRQADWQTQQWEKGHGRQELRTGYCYNITPAWFGEKWSATGLNTLVVVERQRLRTKDQKHSLETAYFVSNQALKQDKGMELFQAVRNHWTIETDHYIRDVGFGEDKLKCFDPKRVRAFSSLLNLAVNLIRRNNRLDSIQEFREQMCYDRNVALNCLVT